MSPQPGGAPLAARREAAARDWTGRGWPRWSLYLFALAATLAMLWLRGRIAVAFDDRPLLILLMLPIVLSASLGGLGPGLLATLTAALGINLLALPPTGTLHLEHSHDLVQLAVLVLNGVLVSGLSERLHRARRQSELSRAAQVRANLDLADRKQRLRLALDAAHAGTWEWHPDTDRNLWSDEIWALCGLALGSCEPSFAAWLQTVHRDDRERVAGAVRTASSAGLPFEIEWRVAVPDDRPPRYLLSRGQPIRGQDAALSRYIGIVLDISGRRQAEESLRASEERLRVSQRLAGVGHWSWDLRTGTHVWSEEIYRIYGRDPALPPADAQEVAAYFAPESWARLSAAVQAALGDGTPYACDAQVVRPDGTRRWIQARGAASRDRDGTPCRLYGTVQDITERYRAEETIRRINADLERRVAQRTRELRAAVAELEGFADAVSHDLRGPLRAIAGFGRALREDFGASLSGDAARYLGHIDQAATAMSALIDGLLSLSRATRGELRREPVDLSALARDICTDLARAAPVPAADWQVEPGLVAEGDPRLLASVLRNLLDNAWKYSARTDAPRIRVYALGEGSGRRYCVSDNGAGFDPALADRLFEPFRRLHPQDRFPGIGIGLATVRRIVRRHGGEIAGQGAPGQGATFCFTLGGAESAGAARP